MSDTISHANERGTAQSMNDMHRGMLTVSLTNRHSTGAIHTETSEMFERERSWSGPPETHVGKTGIGIKKWLCPIELIGARPLCSQSHL